MQKKSSFINIETIIVIIIALLIVFLNDFASGKMDELDDAGDEALFIREDLAYNDSEILAEQIVQYHPDSCKMIEMYDENFEMVFSIQFSDQVIPNTDIRAYPELMELLMNSDEGQTTITEDGVEEAVHFQWAPNNRGEKRLVIVYSVKPEVKDTWVCSFICYMILILIFVLLWRAHHKSLKDKIAQYKSVSDSVRDEINNH